MKNSKSISPLAMIMGLTLGIAITYTTVAVCVVTYPWLSQAIGNIGALTVDALLSINVYTLLLNGDNKAS